MIPFRLGLTEPLFIIVFDIPVRDVRQPRNLRLATLPQNSLSPVVSISP